MFLFYTPENINCQEYRKEALAWNEFREISTHPAFNCSKLTIETLVQDVT